MTSTLLPHHNACCGSAVMLLLFGALLLVSCSSNQGADVEPKALFRPGCLAIVDSPLVFVNTSRGVESLEWEFGDGRTSTEPEPMLSFDSAGDYRVRLLVRGSDGGVDSLVRMVKISPPIGDDAVIPFTEVDVDGSLSPWIANLVSILKYYGVERQQCTILSALFRTDCCANATGCRTLPSDGELQLLLEDFGSLDAKLQYAPLSLEQIKVELWQGRPVYARYTSSPYAIDLVIVGYSASDEVAVFEPGYGTAWFPYKDMLQFQSLGRPGQYHWERSIYCIQPL